MATERFVAEMIWVRRCVKYAVLTVLTMLAVIQDMVDVSPRFFYSCASTHVLIAVDLTLDGHS